MPVVDLALAGVAVGAIAALAGMGLLATYRSTGVFNLGFGAVAVVVAYLLWQMVRVWHWPLGVAAPVAVLLVGPAIGVALERFVFRPLQRRRASPAETLVATVGVLVLGIGLVVLVWGTGARSDAPSLLPTSSLALPGGHAVGIDTLVAVGIALLVALLMGLVTEFTRFGAQIKAVVDRRDLAEFTGINANRVASVGWAFGCFLAGLAGVLLAPRLRLDPYGLTLVVLETMAVAVAARLVSLPVAGVVAIAIGVAQSELTGVHVSGGWQQVVQSLQANLFVVALLAALLVLPNLREIGSRAAGAATSLASRRLGPPRRGWWLVWLAFLLPLALSPSDLRTAQQVPALAVVFVSIVVITGYSGQISLGQAGFAGLGALLAARLAGGQLWGIPALPGLAALVVGALLVSVLGLLTGWPAIRRRGLFLALTTFAVGAIVSRFVLNQPVFTSGVAVLRPPGFRSDAAFYGLELVCLAIALIIVRDLHTGRLGRALIAIRDHEGGARAAGVDVGGLKVFVFAVGAVLAGLGGVLMTMTTQSFDASTFDPVQGLVWFAAVVVFGADSASGAVLAATAFVLLDGVGDGVAIAVMGGLALLLGRMPGGLAGAWRSLSSHLLARYGPPASPPARRLHLSPAGRAAVARVRVARGGPR